MQCGMTHGAPENICGCQIGRQTRILALIYSRYRADGIIYMSCKKWHLRNWARNNPAVAFRMYKIYVGRHLPKQLAHITAAYAMSKQYQLNIYFFNWYKIHKK